MYSMPYQTQSFVFPLDVWKSLNTRENLPRLIPLVPFRHTRVCEVNLKIQYQIVIPTGISTIIATGMRCLYSWLIHITHY